MKQTSFSYVALRVVLALFTLLMLTFCGFGFLATFEPLPEAQQWLWRTIYGVVGLGCVCALARLVASWSRNSKAQE